MTAVEDINSYGVIAYAHADEIKKFAPVFAASMPGCLMRKKQRRTSCFATVLKIPITFCPCSQFAPRATHLITHDRA